METDPNTATPLLVPAACPVADRPQGAPSLSGKLKIRVSPESLAYRIYQKAEVEEPFSCNYELNPAFRGKLEASGLQVSGATADGGARIIELLEHRFFLATGFLPQYTSEEGKPHPLILAYLQAALNYQKDRGV